MTDKHLKELATEIETSLQSGAVTDQDRAVLKQVQSELQTVLGAPASLASPPSGLRDKLTQVIERLEGEHPRLTSLLSKSLDALSDVGI
jgi:HPt (histidine-containing phosphotransfer) domain-containing protein